MKFQLVTWLSVMMLACACSAQPRPSHEQVKRVQDKAAAFTSQLQGLHATGADVASLVATGKRVKALAEAQRLAEAEALLDKGLAQLAEVGAEFDRIAGSPNPQRVGRFFKHPRPIEIHGYPADKHAMEPFISRDGQYLFWNNLNKSSVNTNLYHARRINDFEFEYLGEVEGVNTGYLEGVPSMDRHAHFYFVSPRMFPRSHQIIYRGRFSEGRVADVHQVPGIHPRAPGWINMDCEISHDGNTLIYTQSRFETGVEAPLESYFEVAHRDNDGTFTTHPDSTRIMRRINDSGSVHYANALSKDGLELLFTRLIRGNGNAMPRFEILRSSRSNVHSAFESPQRLTVFTGLFEAPTLTADGSRLYYHQRIGPHWRIFTVARR